MLRLCLLALLVPLPLAAADENDDVSTRHFKRNIFLDGAKDYRPAVAFQHEMSAPGDAVRFELVFKRGLVRKKGRGTTAGIYLEYNDATRPTHSKTNPFCPIPLQKGWNPEWKSFVGDGFKFPNPEDGYWYTWGRQREPLARPVLVRFPERGRYRIRIKGVTDEQDRDIRAATLVGITEIGVGPALPAIVRRATPARPGELLPPIPAPVPGAKERLFVPTGRAATSILAIERESPRSVAAGEEFTVTIRVRNLTAHPIDGLTIVEEGAKLDVLTDEAGLEHHADSRLRWPLGTLRARSTKTLTFRAKVRTPGAMARRVRAVFRSVELDQTLEVR